MASESSVSPGPREADPGVSSQEAGRSVDQSRSRVFPCDGCGANLEFSIGAQSLACPFCGHVKELDLDLDEAVVEQDLSAMLERLAARGADAGSARMSGVREVRCDDCGADVQFSGTLTSDDCPYCGAAIQLEGIHDVTDGIAVDGVLPFRIERDVARRNLAAWVRSRWFAPNEFKRKGADGRFNGVYLPFWTYDALTTNAYRGERGEHYWVEVKRGDRTERVMKTRWHPASGSFRRFFDDVLVLAGKGLPKALVDRLDPWPLDTCIPFTPEVLAGSLARTYDVGLDEGFREARGRMDAAIRDETRRRIGGDEQRIHMLRSEFGALTFKHLLLPVWLLAYRFRGKTYQVAVNAATGEVQGDRPWSWLKIGAAVLVATVVGLGIWLATRSA